MKKIGGARRKTRHIFTKHKRERGKISLTSYLKSFKVGDRVKLSVEPAVQRGMYHPTFYGKSGTISGKAGRCYEVLIKDGGKQKSLIVHPIHLQRE